MLPSGSRVSRKFSMRMSWSGWSALAMRPEMRVQFDADEAHALVAQAHEIAGAAAGLQDRGVAGDAQAAHGLVHGRDDGRGGVEGIEGGAFGAVVFLGRQQRLQFFAEGLPAGVLVAAGDRVGEDRQGDRPEAGEAGERLPLLRGGGPLVLLDGLESADGGEDVACLCFFAAGDGERRVRQGMFRKRGGRIGRIPGRRRQAVWRQPQRASLPIRAAVR